MHNFVGFLQIAGQQKWTCETQSRVARLLFSFILGQGKVVWYTDC